MLDYFFNIRNKLLSKGSKVSENVWELDTCTYESMMNKEKITVPGLIDVVFSNGVLVYITGSEDALKFLEASI